MAKRKPNLEPKPFNEYLIAHVKINSVQTRSSYTRTVRQFYQYIGKEYPKEFTDKEIERYKVWCNTEANNGKPYDSNTLIPKYSAINTLIDHLKLNIEHLKTPQKRIKVKEMLNEEEISRMLESAKKNPRDYSILNTLIFSLQRKTEIFNLNVEDVDFNEYKLYIRKAKGNQSRVINLREEVIVSLKRWLDTREPNNPEEKALFLNEFGERIGSTSLKAILNKYAVKAKITKRVYPHLLRASMATIMHDKGATLPEIQAQTGHKSIDTLVKHYIQSSAKHNREAYLKYTSLGEEKKPEENRTKKVNKPEPKKPDNKPDVAYSKTNNTYFDLLLKEMITPEQYVILMSKQERHEISNPEIYA